MDIAGLDFDFGAQRGDALQVEVDGPGTNDAPARQGDGRFAQARQERPENTDGSAHFADQIVVTDPFDLVSLDGQGVAYELYVGSDGTEDLAHEPHIAEIGKPADDAAFACEQGGRHDGQRSVF